MKNISKKIKGAKKGKLLSKTTTGEVVDIYASEPARDKADSILDLTSVDKISANNKPDFQKDTIIKKDSLKNTIANNLPHKKNADKKRKVNTSRFYFLGSIGADAGSVKLLSFDNSKITAKYGVGIGYQINKKFSVQTGFYASRKKYIAGPGDYKAKRGFLSTIEMKKVEASCLVYDIPLTIRYNFLQKPATVYFASAGLSSFIMKKEAYNCYFPLNNMPFDSLYNYTGNKNFFSVFNLSFGIEKKLSPDFSILAEPSISIPLSGVGEGNVKLYSAALQFSIKYNPYRKHK
ncbi:outer membrane beta-barrel protein [Ferruginibacter sp.]|uniref:outer membrane beta-barrel protein n=1 Tax=Ferruginibacter sp. TaxID=1940288 RepID=UPI00265B5611|nr:outer membrane beta-barrel protein [Ferruginibacter sp.]